MSALWQAYLIGWGAAAPIGPVNLEIIRRALRLRLAAGLAVGLGATMVDFAYVMLTGFGLAGLLQNRTVMLGAYVFGAAFLGWLAWSALREAAREWRGEVPQPSAPPTGAPAASAHPLWKSWLVGVGMTAANPYTIAFWATLPALLFPNGHPAAWEILRAGAWVWLGTISWVLLLIAMLGFARRLVGPRLFAAASGLGGAVMLYFAARFAWLAARMIAGG
ncbi:MAG: LysE family transporter [Sumerlaeia bacterium]